MQRERKLATVFCSKAKGMNESSFAIRRGFADIAVDFGYRGVKFSQDPLDCCNRDLLPYDILYDENGTTDADIAPAEISIVDDIVMYKGPMVSERMSRYLVQRESLNMMEKMMKVIGESGCGDYDPGAMRSGIPEDEMRSLVKVLSFYREYGMKVDFFLAGLNGDYKWNEPFPIYEIQNALRYPRNDDLGGFPARICDLCKIWERALDKRESRGYIPLEGSNLEHIGKVLGINQMVAAYYDKTASLKLKLAS